MAKKDSDGWQSAVCAEHPMAEGAHYVEMTLVEEGSEGAYMAVVGQGFDAAGGGAAYQSAEGWLFSTWNGNLYYAGAFSKCDKACGGGSFHSFLLLSLGLRLPNSHLFFSNIA